MSRRLARRQSGSDKNHASPTNSSLEAHSAHLYFVVSKLFGEVAGLTGTELSKRKNSKLMCGALGSPLNSSAQAAQGPEIFMCFFL